MERLFSLLMHLSSSKIPVPLDKQAHFASGALLGIAMFMLTDSIGISFVSVSLVAMFKEIYDLLHRNKHTPDVWDWVATSLGGLLGTLLTKLVLFSA